MQKVFTINLNNPQAILWCQTNTVFCHPIFFDQFPVSLWARSYHLDKLQIFRAISHWQRERRGRERKGGKGVGGELPTMFNFLITSEHTEQYKQTTVSTNKTHPPFCHTKAKQNTIYTAIHFFHSRTFLATLQSIHFFQSCTFLATLQSIHFFQSCTFLATLQSIHFFQSCTFLATLQSISKPF